MLLCRHGLVFLLFNDDGVVVVMVYCQSLLLCDE